MSTKKPKRKYVRNKKERKITSDGNVIKSTPKKRGRKKGKNKKDELMKPEDVLDYMIRNFPNMEIEKIRNKVLDGLKNKKKMEDEPYILDKFPLNGKSYYYDDNGIVFDIDANIVGFFVSHDNGTKKLYMINDDNNNMTYDEIIASIENI